MQAESRKPHLIPPKRGLYFWIPRILEAFLHLAARIKQAKGEGEGEKQRRGEVPSTELGSKQLRNSWRIINATTQPPEESLLKGFQRDIRKG